jgi:hypothetical protein
MAKRNSEHPKVLLQKKLGGWTFVDAYGEEQCAGYAIGSVVEAQFWQKRSLEHLRLYWAVLGECVNNSEGKYGSAEDLHEVLKIALGYTRKIELLLPSEHVDAADVIGKALRAAQSAINGCRWVLRRVLGEFWLTPHLDAANNQLASARLRIGEITQSRMQVTLPGSIAFHSMDQAEFKVFFENAINQLRRAGYPVDEFIEAGKAKLARIKNYQKSLPQRGATNGPVAAESSA